MYRRDKDKVEIEGSAKDVRWLVFIDLFGHRLCKALVLVSALFLVPKIAVGIAMLKWIRRKIGI